MGPWKLTPKNVQAVSSYWERIEAARKIDPEAFKPTMIPHFSPDKLVRQREAMRKVTTPDDQS